MARTLTEGQIWCQRGAARSRAPEFGVTVELCYSYSVAVSPSFWAGVSLVLATLLGAPTVAYAVETGDPLAFAPDEAIASKNTSDRRRTFIAVVGLAALAFGATGLYLMRRKKRQEHVPEPEEPVVEAAIEPTSKPPASSAPLMVMICPTCLEQYPVDARFCKLDGNRLVALREGADPRGPTGGVCPICCQGYDPGVVVCPQHQEDLIPAPIHLAQRASGSYPKICPTCGVQYPIGSGFCGADGSVLVTVN